MVKLVFKIASSRQVCTEMIGKSEWDGPCWEGNSVFLQTLPTCVGSHHPSLVLHLSSLLKDDAAGSQFMHFVCVCVVRCMLLLRSLLQVGGGGLGSCRAPVCLPAVAPRPPFLLCAPGYVAATRPRPIGLGAPSAGLALLQARLFRQACHLGTRDVSLFCCQGAVCCGGPECVRGGNRDAVTGVARAQLDHNRGADQIVKNTSASILRNFPPSFPPKLFPNTFLQAQVWGGGKVSGGNPWSPWVMGEPMRCCHGSTSRSTARDTQNQAAALW